MILMINRKPKKNPKELVQMLKSEKGITFNYITEKEAILFLSERNNYFRVASYRNNYDKYQKGNSQGKYIDLDFSYLIELSTIDMHLRFLLLKMCMDIEHHIKVELLRDLEDNTDEDGYDIVNNFLQSYPLVKQNIIKKRYSSYIGDLIKKYFIFSKDYKTIENIECPAWALLEIITFGDLIRFYDYYHELYPTIRNHINLLNSIKSLRNACAHNNCILHQLRSGGTKPGAKISQFVAKIPSISNNTSRKRLSSRPIYEITALFYLYHEIISKDIKNNRATELKELFEIRMLRHKEWFENQKTISSSYIFLKKIIDFLYS